MILNTSLKLEKPVKLNELKRGNIFFLGEDELYIVCEINGIRTFINIIDGTENSFFVDEDICIPCTLSFHQLFVPEKYFSENEQYFG